MISRAIQPEIAELLREFPAVGLLGPRQVGKTTLAEALSRDFQPAPIYLDLESPADRAKINDPEAYFELYKDRLIILDEVQRAPELFQVLRGVIDKRKRQGFRTGQFLILGSASLELLKQSSESLAGRIAYKELTGLTAIEVKFAEQDKLWLRGTFPDSFLAADDAASIRWRQNFISTYLEREVPQFGPRIPAALLRRLWTMLSHNQGEVINASRFASSLDVSVPTIKRYMELLEDLLLIRTLRPWSGNVGKRLVKAPKVYIRDSGITHALLNIESFDDLLSHSVAGSSWEGFVIENLLAVVPIGATAWYYRTSAGAEIDLVIELGGKRCYAIEIKRSSAPNVSKGFYVGCEDVNAVKRYIVYPGKEKFEITKGVTAMPLREMMTEVKSMK